MPDYFGRNLEPLVNISSPTVDPTEGFKEQGILTRAQMEIEKRANDRSNEPNSAQKALDAIANAPQSAEMKLAPTYFDWDRSGADRYVNSDYYKELGFDPNANNEEKYGQRQTFGNTMSNAFAGAGKLAYNGFVDGWKGWGRLSDAAINLDWDLIKGDEASLMALNKDMEDAMNNNAIFSTAESDETFWNKQTFGNFVQQSGFTVGALSQMITEQALTKLVEGALVASVVGSGAAAALEVATAAKTTAGIGRMVQGIERGKTILNSANTFKTMKKLGDTWKSSEIASNILKGVGSKIPGVDILMDINKAREVAGATGKALTALDIANIGRSGIQRLLSEGNFAFTEARMEAAGTYSDIYNDLYYDYVDSRGEAPNADEIKEIQSVAQKAADGNFDFNAGVLAVSNRIQFDNMFKGFKAQSRMGKLFGAGAEGLEDVLTVTGDVAGKRLTQHYQKGFFGATGNYRKIANDFGRTQALKEAGYGTLSHLMKWEVSEGVQELLQEGSGTYFKDYYSDLYKTGTADPNKSFGEAVDSQLNIQGLKTFMSGALTGMVISGPSRIVSEAANKVTDKASDRKYTQGMTPEQKKEYYDNKTASKDKRQLLLDELNTVMKDPGKVFPEIAKNFNVQSEASQAMEDAASEKDLFSFNNIRDTAFGNLIAKAVRTNTHEGLIDTLNEYTKHFTKEEFEKAFVGTEFTDTNKKSVQDYVGKILKGIETYNSTYQNLQDKYGDRINPNLFKPNTLEYREAMLAKKTLDDMLDIIASNSLKSEQVTYRMEGIFKNLAGRKELGSILSSSFGTLTSSTKRRNELNIIRLEIKNLKENPSRTADDNKRLKAKENTQKILDEWAALDLKEQKDQSRAKKLLRDFIDAKNQEAGSDAFAMNEEDIELSLEDLRDYTELQSKSQDLVDATNAITNPKNFNILHERMQRGALLAELDTVIEFRSYTEDPVDENDIKEFEALTLKGDWTDSDRARYSQLAKNIYSIIEEDPIKNEDPVDEAILAATGRYYVHVQENGLFAIVDPEGKILERDLDDRESAKTRIEGLNQILDDKDNKRKADDKAKLDAETKKERLERERLELAQFKKDFKIKGIYDTVNGRMQIVKINATSVEILALDEAPYSGHYTFEGFRKKVADAPVNEGNENKTKLSSSEIVAELTAKKGLAIMDPATITFLESQTNDFTEAQWLDVIKAFSDGKVSEDIADEMGVDPIKIKAVAMILGIPTVSKDAGAEAGHNEWAKETESLFTQLEEARKQPEPVRDSILDQVSKIDPLLKGFQLTPLVSEILNSTEIKEDHYNALKEKIKEVKSPMVRIALNKLVENHQNQTSQYIRISELVEDLFADNNGNKNGENLLYSYAAETGAYIANIKELQKLVKEGTELLVEVSNEDQGSEQEILNAIQKIAPNRKHITYETKQQQAMLEAGQSIITVGSVKTGATVWIKEPLSGQRFSVSFPDKYVVVHPDNRTEDLDFNNKIHLEMVKKFFVVESEDSKTVPVDQVMVKTLEDAHRKINLFKNEALALPRFNGPRVDATMLFNKYFALTILSSTSTAGNRSGSLVDYINNNSSTLTTLRVGTFDDEGSLVSIEDKEFPLIYTRKKDKWSFEDPKLKENERYVDENGSIIDLDTAIKSLNLDIQLTSSFPSYHALITHKADGSVYPVALDRKTGTRPVIGFMELFSKLIETLTNSKSKTIGESNGDFNKINNSSYGFKERNGWTAEFNRDFKGEKLIIEIKHPELVKPMKVSVPELITSQFSQLLRNYSESTGLKGAALFASVEKNPDLSKAITNLYYELTQSIANNFSKAVNKNKDLLSGIETQPAINLLLENQQNDLRGNWDLKSKNWDMDLSEPMSYKLVAVENTRKSNKIAITQKDNASTELVSSNSNKKQAMQSEVIEKTSTEKIADNLKQSGFDVEVVKTPTLNDSSSGKRSNRKSRPIGGAMSLESDGPRNRSSNETSYAQELDWFVKNMPSQFKIEDLSDIVDKLNTGETVLGYYKDQILYLNRLISSRGTLYHESFHAVFRDLFDEETRNHYRALAFEQIGSISREEYNEFVEKRNLKGEDSDHVVSLIAEEWIADGFKKHMLENYKPNMNWLQKIFKVLKDLINLFTRKNSEFNKLFKDIEKGVYKNSPVTNEKMNGGAFELSFGRPMVKNFTNEDGSVEESIIPVHVTSRIQDQIVNRLTYEINRISDDTAESFDDKYKLAQEKLRSEFQNNNIFSQVKPDKLNRAKDKFQDMLYEYQYLLGESVPLIYGEGVPNQNEFTDDDDYQDTDRILRKQVKFKVDNINIVRSLEEIHQENDENNLDDEDKEEVEKGGEFDLVNLNPLHGLSKEFRSMFSLVPTTFTDAETGVTMTRMIDGNRIFDGMMKLSANIMPGQIFESLENALEVMKFNDDENHQTFSEMYAYLTKTFGLQDHDGKITATKNKQLYNQFLDVFFVAEMPAKQAVLTTNGKASKVEIIDASLQADITAGFDKIAFEFERTFSKLSHEEQQQRINEYQAVYAGFFDYGKQGNITGSFKVNHFQDLKRAADRLEKGLTGIGISVPKHLIAQSLVGIYIESNPSVLEEPGFKRSRAFKIYNTQKGLFKEGAFLQKEFFRKVHDVKPGQNIFQKTKVDSKLGKREARDINMINGILKKAVKMIVKYDLGSSVSVFKNGEGKNIYRYTHHTPPSLITQIAREDGIEGVLDVTNRDLYEPWLNDNPLLSSMKGLVHDRDTDVAGNVTKTYYQNDRNDLFLKNFNLGMFGGFRQTLNKSERDGVAFGSIDPRTLALSNILFFMDRKTIENENAKVTVFDRSRTQEEATTTNFMVSALYDKRTGEKGVTTDETLNLFIKGVEQEFNRISREWSSQDDPHTVRYKDYNDFTNEKSKLRSMKFVTMDHLFRSNPELGQELIKKAKRGLSFSDALAGQEDLMKEHTREFLKGTYDAYINELLAIGVIERSKTGEIKSELIPNKLKIDYTSSDIKIHGYENLEEMLKDFHLNIIINKLFVNQIYDGDIAVGIKSSIDYYKRNKSGVISGSSMREGRHRTAVISELYTYMDNKDLTKTQEDNDSNLKDRHSVLDGGSMHTMNHRIQMVQKWGRGSDRVLDLLKSARYRSLTNAEITELERQQVVLNALKTATGGVLDYIKMAEQVLLRPSVSKLVLKEGMTESQAFERLHELHGQIDELENDLLNNINDDPIIESQIRNLYTEVHSFWEPRFESVEMHHLLNSMEMSGIDQMYDTNSSKKATVVPVEFNPSGYTDLAQSRTFVPNVFKFMQVETAGIHDHITLPTQVRQLLTVYLKGSGHDRLEALAEKYSEVLGDITKSSQQKIDNILLDESGKNVDFAELYKAMHEGLQTQGADSNTLKFLELDAEGKPTHNINIPMIKKMFVYYYFAYFSKNVFSESVAGRKDILISAYGRKVIEHNGQIIKAEEYNKNPDKYPGATTRNLGVDIVENKDGTKIYYMEVMIPKPLFENGDHQDFWEEKMSKMFSTRIPTEDKRSMFVAKVVDYIDPAYRNNIVVPQQIHVLSGSDLDVDSVYSHTQDAYKDFNGIWHVFGDYSGYKKAYSTTESQARFAEYIAYMSKDKSLKDLIDREKKEIDQTANFPKEIEKLYQELNLPQDIKSMEELVSELEPKKEQLKAIRSEQRESFSDQQWIYKELQEVIDENQKRKADPNLLRPNVELEKDLRKSLYEQMSITGQLAEDLKYQMEKAGELKDEIRRINNFINLSATINVLKRKNLPITNKGYTQRKNDTGALVTPALHNESLNQKIEILSNEKVFNEMYINERADTEPFRRIAESIGASTEDLADANPIYTALADLVANRLNASSKDGIALAASFNKFMAFAEKNQISLKEPLVKTSFENNKTSQLHGDFKDGNKTAIRTIGGLLGMFADAVKDPIPSVLNLNTITIPITNVFLGSGVSTDLALLMNKIPLIEKITTEAINNASSTQTNQGQYQKKAFGSLAKSKLKEEHDAIKEIYKVSKIGKTVVKANGNYRLRDFTIQMSTPNSNFVNLENPTLADLGISVVDEAKNRISDHEASHFILATYLDAADIGADAIKLGSVLNLIKSIKPSFETLDGIVNNWQYFLKDASSLKNMDLILSKSKEYKPLIESIDKMDTYSKDVLIERDPLFYAIDKSIKSSLNTFEIGKVQAREAVTDQIIKFLIINRFKIDASEKLAIQQKRFEEGAYSPLYLENAQNAVKFFDEDYWMDNDFKVDFFYLLENHSGNSFVEFIKTHDRSGILIFEAISRMKLDPDVTEDLIASFQALERNPDDRTQLIARKLLYQTIVKDGMGYSGNSFTKYLNPMMLDILGISSGLTELQDILRSVKIDIENEIKNSQDSDFNIAIFDRIFKEYFKTDSGTTSQYVNTMIDRMGTWEGNASLRVSSRTFNPYKKVGNVDLNKVSVSQLEYTLSKILPETHAQNKDAMVKEDNGSIKYVYDPYNPTSDLVDEGKVVIDLSSIGGYNYSVFNGVLAQMDIEAETIGKNTTFSFPSFVKNKRGQILKLDTVNGRSVSKTITSNVFNSMTDPLFSASYGFKGSRAVYILTETSGTKHLLNFGFSKEAGRKLYLNSVKDVVNQDLKPMVPEAAPEGLFEDPIPKQDPVKEEKPVVKAQPTELGQGLFETMIEFNRDEKKKILQSFFNMSPEAYNNDLKNVIQKINIALDHDRKGTIDKFKECIL